MTKTDDGGPAFPTIVPIDQRVVPMIVEFHAGISMRDYFAAKAIQALVARGVVSNTEEHLAKLAYVIADAMLKERG